MLTDGGIGIKAGFRWAKTSESLLTTYRDNIFRMVLKDGTSLPDKLMCAHGTSLQCTKTIEGGNSSYSRMLIILFVFISTNTKGETRDSSTTVEDDSLATGGTI